MSYLYRSTFRMKSASLTFIIVACLIGGLQGAQQTKKRNAVDKPRPSPSSINNDWSPWSEWSTCSRSCDLGVTSRTRQCTKTTSTSGSVGGISYQQPLVPVAKATCLGVYRQYNTCNTQSCPGPSKEFRLVQCERFNTQSFHGRFYQWTPYYKGINKCELSCRPKDRRFFVQLANIVVDGTRCDPRDPNHICIAGNCELVGCDGVVGSEKRLDKCGVCGGNDSTCHVISGIFTRTRLPTGYNRVTSVPRGACNINVTELIVSPNHLAIRLANGRYIVNGDIKSLGLSGDFPGAGTVFSYRRPSLEEPGLEPAVETILAAGPINESIDIMVVQENENRGIMYSYTVPTSSRQHQHGVRHQGGRHHKRPGRAKLCYRRQSDQC